MRNTFHELIRVRSMARWPGGIEGGGIKDNPLLNWGLRVTLPDAIMSWVM